MKDLGQQCPDIYFCNYGLWGTISMCSGQVVGLPQDPRYLVPKQTSVHILPNDPMYIKLSQPCPAQDWTQTRGMAARSTNLRAIELSCSCYLLIMHQVLIYVGMLHLLFCLTKGRVTLFLASDGFVCLFVCLIVFKGFIDHFSKRQFVLLVFEF